MHITLENSRRIPVSRPSLGRDEQKRACIVCRGRLEGLVVRTFDTRFGVVGEYEVWQCGQCQLEQMFPVPTVAELKALYEMHYNFGGEKGTTYTLLREAFFSSFLYRLWLRIDGDLSFHARRGTGRLIDVGCNEGRGLSLYKSNGFQVEGMELNETAATQSRNRGFTVHTTPVGDLPQTSYDVAVLSNVLEHAVDPRQMLSEVHRILRSNGKIWISCPNIQSWLRKIFGKYWINWHLPFHISHFSSKTIRELLNQAGFTEIEIRQVTPATWVAMSIISKIFAKEGHPNRQLRNPMLFAALVVVVRFFAFPLLAFKNHVGEGDCLLVIASKS